MKRYGNLYKKICSIENLREAHKNARKGKGWYEEVRKVDGSLEYYLYYLQWMFKHHEYHTSKYEMFTKKDGKKNRKIYKLPYFPDRIAQWAILQVIEPYIIKTLIAETYSAIPERGIHKGLECLKYAMEHDVMGCQYCLKIDARHYYQSINHEVLKEKYRRLFKDRDLLSLLDEIIDSIDTAEESDLCAIYLIDEDIDPETGIPIGNYLSQYSGNFYFSSFDHWMKEEKHIRHYFRYMDDIVIFAETKEELHSLILEIKDYFRERLKLSVKDNWQIFETYSRGVDFLGYRVFMGYVLLRKTTCTSMKKKLARIYEKCRSGQQMNYSEYCSINSYRGWVKPCNGFRLQKKYIFPVLPYADSYYKNNLKKGAA